MKITSFYPRSPGPRDDTSAIRLNFPLSLLTFACFSIPKMMAAARRIALRAGRTATKRNLHLTRHLSTATVSPPPPLVGSAPEYPRHLIIHASQQATDWPSHLESTSQLYKELGARWAKHPELKKLGFGLSDAGTRQQHTEKAERWDRNRARFEEPPAGQPEER